MVFMKLLAGTTVALKQNQENRKAMRKNFNGVPMTRIQSRRQIPWRSVTIVPETAERRDETISDIRLQFARSALLTVNETAPTSKAAAH
jgi:hypothetical protein